MSVRYILRSSVLTGVYVEAEASAAGGDLITELTVDGRTLEVRQAATRLLRQGVVNPLHEALNWRSNEEAR